MNKREGGVREAGSEIMNERKGGVREAGSE